MSEPVFDETTEGIYARLPEHFRRVDTNYHLKKYLSGTGAILDETFKLIDRFNYEPLDEGGQPGDTSDLVDPHTADEAWLPWLAQLLGVKDTTGLAGDYGLRHAIHQASSGYLAGTNRAIVAAVQSVLVGSKSVRLRKRTTSVGVGGAWDLLIQTLDSETLKNVLPSHIVLPVSINNWTVVSVPPGNTANVQLGIASDDDYYSSKAISFTSTGIDSMDFGEGMFGDEEYGGEPSTIPTEYFIYSPFYFPLSINDPLTTMIDISCISGENAVNVQAGIDLFQFSGGVYTNLNTFVGSGIISLDPGEGDRFLGRSANIGASATHGRFKIHVTNFDNAEIHFAHMGARLEDNYTWVPYTADPIDAVVSRGAKPAGIKLHHDTVTTSWSTLENGGVTTWADLEEADTWTKVEEYGE